MAHGFGTRIVLGLKAPLWKPEAVQAPWLFALCPGPRHQAVLISIFVSGSSSPLGPISRWCSPTPISLLRSLSSPSLRPLQPLTPKPSFALLLPGPSDSCPCPSPSSSAAGRGWNRKHWSCRAPRPLAVPVPLRRKAHQPARPALSGSRLRELQSSHVLTWKSGWLDRQPRIRVGYSSKATNYFPGIQVLHGSKLIQVPNTLPAVHITCICESRSKAKKHSLELVPHSQSKMLLLHR